VVSTGWTWREAGDLTFPQYKALARQWRKTPPAHLLLAGYVGYTPPAEFTPEDRLAGQEDSLNELAALDGVVFQN
jgi:hypothetical protein